jgi:magnesium chelatase subunit I
MIRLFPSQFVLIGSMNPEEGTLRPQIMDRFGLRVWVAPLDDARQRLEVYRRARSFRADPVAFRAFYAEQTAALREEVTIAREILPHITVPPEVETLALNIIQQLSIPSHRAEIALLEAARARAAADFRSEVHVEDVQRMALLALRQRRSTSLDAYAEQVRQESELVNTVLNKTLPTSSDGHAAASPPQDATADTGAAPARRRSGKRNKVRDLEQDSQS